MKTFIKSTAVLAALLGISLAQAGNTVSSIPMGVNVPKSCLFSGLSAGIVVPENASEATGSFKISCNTGYAVRFDTNSIKASSSGTYVKNIQEIVLKTSTSVTWWGLTHPIIYSAPTYRDSYPIYIGEQPGSVRMKLSNPISAATPAGVYTDTFHMTVTY